MDVIEVWGESGHTFMIERLAEPRLIGASERRYRLYDNGEPASGGQWHGSIESAKNRAQYVVLCTDQARIRHLEARIVALEHELRSIRGTQPSLNEECP